VEEFVELWKGVHAYDANTRKMFDLHAAVCGASMVTLL
jgi:hypothetical protein